MRERAHKDGGGSGNLGIPARVIVDAAVCINDAAVAG
jgi:hypothetical protein